jgi:bla regulator protein BlaR1
MTQATGFLWAAAELMGNHLWQSTLVAAAAGLLALAFRSNAARVRYWLWLAASVKFLIPFAALVPIGVRMGWRSAVSIAEPDMTQIVDALSQPFSQPAFRTAFATPAAPSSGMAAALPISLLAVWFGGCVLIVGAWCGGWRRVTAAMRDASRVESGREVDMLRRLQKICRISRPIALVSTNTSLEPGVFGIVRPVLLWSQRVGERLADAEVEAVLAHEVCHVRRHDNLAAAVHMVVEALFWFHPLVWWVGARLVDERERACDEEVVRLGSDPQVYAESILKMCAFYTESPLGCVAGVTSADLKKRIEAIVINRIAHKLSARKRLLLVSAAVGLVLGPIAVGVMNAPRLQAQSPPTTRLTFEVASVKANKSAEIGGSFSGRPGGQLVVRNNTLRNVIRNAYQLQNFQMIGGPDWLDTDRFDITAKASTENATVPEMLVMVQELLADRFKLVVHRETRELPIYALVLARRDGRLGSKLTRSTTDCVAIAVAARRGGPPPAPTPGAAPLCGTRTTPGRILAGGVTMADLARNVSNVADRMTLDKTGLAGAFDLSLEYTPDRLPPPGTLPPGMPEPPADGASLFTAMQEQLGLKLDSQRGPVDVLVIDSAQQPSAN